MNMQASLKLSLVDRAHNSRKMLGRIGVKKKNIQNEIIRILFLHEIERKNRESECSSSGRRRDVSVFCKSVSVNLCKALELTGFKRIVKLLQFVFK